MSTFDDAVKYVLKWEGGLVDNSLDPGGITNMGISVKFLRSIPGKYCQDEDVSRCNFIKNISESAAIQIYKDEFWNPIFDKIVNKDAAIYIFDMTVNNGKKEAIVISQRSLWSQFPNKRTEITVDGIFGQKTLSLINQTGPFIMTSLRAERAGFYRSIVAQHPSEMRFLDGWLSRAYGL